MALMETWARSLVKLGTRLRGEYDVQLRTQAHLFIWAEEARAMKIQCTEGEQVMTRTLASLSAMKVQYCIDKAGFNVTK